MRTILLSIALVSLLLQSEFCQKRSEQKPPPTSPTPVVSPTSSVSPNKTTAPPSDASTVSLQQGVWGGRGISLQITPGGAEVEFDCAHGVIKERIQTRADGSFEVGGTFVPEGGPISVPINGAPQEKSYSAKYRGRVEGQKMTLDVIVAETGAHLKDLSLVRGKPANLEKCY